ncbi:hypothetical protein ABPG72_011745 [Tetrahymena utriculariae]
MRSQKLVVKYIQSNFQNKLQFQQFTQRQKLLRGFNFVGLNKFSKFQFSSEQTGQTQNANNVTQEQQQQQYQKPKSKYQMQLEKRYPKEKILEVQEALKNSKLNLYEYLLKVNNQSSENYEYVSDTLIKNNIDHKLLKGQTKQIIFLTTIWSGVGYLSYLVNPYLSVIPMVFGVSGLISFYSSKRLVSKTIERIEFVPNEIEKIRIYLLKSNEPILCRIDNIEVIDVNENIEHPYLSDKVFRDSKQGISLQKDISITLNAEDLTGQQFNALNLCIFGNKEFTQVPSYNLLQTVLEGDIIRLNKFKIDKKETVSDDFIEKMLSDQSSQAFLDKKKKEEEQVNLLEEQIQQEISKFSKKKN